MNFIELKLFLEKNYSKGFTRGTAIDNMFDMILKRLNELNIEIFNIEQFYKDFLIYVIKFSNYN